MVGPDPVCPHRPPRVSPRRNFRWGPRKVWAVLLHDGPDAKTGGAGFPGGPPPRLFPFVRANPGAGLIRILLSAEWYGAFFFRFSEAVIVESKDSGGGLIQTRVRIWRVGFSRRKIFGILRPQGTRGLAVIWGGSAFVLGDCLRVFEQHENFPFGRNPSAEGAPNHLVGRGTRFWAVQHTKKVKVFFGGGERGWAGGFPGFAAFRGPGDFRGPGQGQGSRVEGTEVCRRIRSKEKHRSQGGLGSTGKRSGGRIGGLDSLGGCRKKKHAPRGRVVGPGAGQKSWSWPTDGSAC